MPVPNAIVKYSNMYSEYGKYNYGGRECLEVDIGGSCGSIGGCTWHACIYIGSKSRSWMCEGEEECDCCI